MWKSSEPCQCPAPHFLILRLLYTSKDYTRNNDHPQSKPNQIKSKQNLYVCVILWSIYSHSDGQRMFLAVSKILEISYDKNNKGVFCYINKVTFGKPLDNLRMKGLIARRAIQWLEGWKLSSSPPPPPISWVGREAGDWVQLPRANGLINHAYVMKPP